MSCAIIRNQKYKIANMPSIGRHNERKNERYGNQDIRPELSYRNYHLKAPKEKSYEKEFERIRLEENLKGNLRLTGKKQSNVACEFLITSDKIFFDRLGEARTREFFEDAYGFVKEKCGEKFVVSAVVHLDETTPHMHVVYIPTVLGRDKNGQECRRVNCSQFWKGFNSYGQLQDKFYEYCASLGYDLERGQIGSEREHLSVTEFKQETAQKQLEVTQQELQSIEEEKNVVLGHLEAVRDVLKTLDNPMAIPTEKTLTGKIKLSYDDFEKLEDTAKAKIALEAENDVLKNDLQRAQKENQKLESRIDDLQADKVYKDYREQLQENLVQEKRHRAELSKLREQYDRQMRQEAMKQVESYLLSISRLQDELAALKAQHEKEKAQYEQRLKEEQKSYFELAMHSSDKDCNLAWAEKVLHQNPELESKYQFGKERPEMQKNLLPAEEKKKDAPLHRSGRDDWER